MTENQAQILISLLEQLVHELRNIDSSIRTIASR